MKKTVLYSITLLATIISSHAFSQNYTYRMPAFGVQNANGKAQPSDNSNCVLDKGGQFVVYNITNENGKMIMQQILERENLSYRNPAFAALSSLSPGYLFLDNEIDFKRGNLMGISDVEGDIDQTPDGITTESYELYICGDAIPPNWEPEDPTVAMCYEQYKREDYKTAMLETFGRESNPGPVFNHPSLFPSYSTVPETQHDGMINTHVFKEGSAYKDSVLGGAASSYVAIYEDGKRVGVKPPWRGAPPALLTGSNTIDQNRIDEFLDNYGVSQGEHIFNHDGIKYYSLYITGGKFVKYIERYSETIKSENYDWCIDNGYSTIRPVSGGGGGSGMH